MSITRRSFMFRVAGGAASAAVAGGAVSFLFSADGPAQGAIARIIHERFPYVSADDPAVRAFAHAFVRRDLDVQGSSSLTKAEAADPENPVIDLERYVAREFATSSNVLQYGSGKHLRLEYAPPRLLDHTAARFVRSPTARARRLAAAGSSG